MSAFRTLLARDLRLALRDGGSLGTALGFYLVVVALLPLGLGPDQQLLGRIAPAVLWIALLLAALLSLSRLFESDHQDGSLEALALGPLPLSLVALAKIVAHWLTVALPLALAAPIAGVMLNLAGGAVPSLLAAFLLGTPAISALGAIGAALTLRARRGGVLVALLVLPLYIPTLIFGIGVLAAGLGPGGGVAASLSILAAISLASLVLGPVAAAAALRAQI
jgi:heme exporter protein B